MIWVGRVIAVTTALSRKTAWKVNHVESGRWSSAEPDAAATCSAPEPSEAAGPGPGVSGGVRDVSMPHIFLHQLRIDVAAGEVIPG